MSGVINGILLTVSGLAMIPLAMELFPKAYEATYQIEVAAGLTLSHDGAMSTGGNSPAIALFDGNGRRIAFQTGKTKVTGIEKDKLITHGVWDKGKLGDGNTATYSLTSLDPNNNKPAEYITVSAGGTDALCIAYVSATMPSKDHWAFYGDVPYTCHQDWYPSHLQVQTAGASYYPKCFWIAAPDPKTGKGKFKQGFSMHISDFAPTKERMTQYKDHPETMCDSAPRFKMYDKLTEYQCPPVFDPPAQYNDNATDVDFEYLKKPGKQACGPGPGEGKPDANAVALNPSKPDPKSGGKLPDDKVTGWKGKRGVKSRRDDPCPHESHVVISDIDAHSAREVCDSESSHGPDFVSTTEGLFCDMCAHQLWKVCGSPDATGCFDVDTQRLRAGGNPLRRDESSADALPEKAYTKVSHWK